MNESNLSQELYGEFNKLCRNLTYATIALVCIAALIIWIFDIDLGGQRTTLMGVSFMVLAAFTFKIPYLSYRYMLSKYKHHEDKSSILGVDWKLFRDNAMQHR